MAKIPEPRQPKRTTEQVEASLKQRSHEVEQGLRGEKTRSTAVTNGLRKESEALAQRVAAIEQTLGLWTPAEKLSGKQDTPANDTLENLFQAIYDTLADLDDRLSVLEDD